MRQIDTKSIVQETFMNNIKTTIIFRRRKISLFQNSVDMLEHNTKFTWHFYDINPKL